MIAMRGFAIAALAPSTANADDNADKPWVVGVSEQAKAAAKQLLERGNAKFVERDYVGALEL
jgi:hypothetical protein